MALQALIGSFFGLLGIYFGFKAGKSAASGNPVAAKVHRRLAVVYILVGMGLWIWYLSG